MLFVFLRLIMVGATAFNFQKFLKLISANFISTFYDRINHNLPKEKDPLDDNMG